MGFVFNKKEENKKDKLYLLPIKEFSDIVGYSTMISSSETLSEDRKKELISVINNAETVLKRKIKNGYYSMSPMATIRGYVKEVTEPMYISIPEDPDLLEIFSNDIESFENITIAMKNILYLLPIKSLEDVASYCKLVKDNSLISEEEKEKLVSLINKGGVCQKIKSSEDKYDITPILNAPKDFEELISKGGHFISFSGDESLRDILDQTLVEYEEKSLPDKNVNCFVSDNQPQKEGPVL